jgi:protein-L-isoaspartate(D-aspartate) O-methyltransferase
MDYADARRRMVDGQIRPNKVTDSRLIEALGGVPRELFLPAGLRGRAYADEDVALPGGTTLLAPMTLAKLLQLAAVRPGDRALVVCAGTGYGAAVLAHIGARVTAVEADASLREIARAAIATCLPAGAVRLEGGDPVAGFAGGAPYDLILLEGAVPALPEALAAQLAEGGRMVAVQGPGGRACRAVLGRRIGGTLSASPAFDCAAAPLAAFAPEPGFVF